MKKIIVSLALLGIMTGCGEKLEPKQCWLATQGHLEVSVLERDYTVPFKTRFDVDFRSIENPDGTIQPIISAPFYPEEIRDERGGIKPEFIVSIKDWGEVRWYRGHARAYGSCHNKNPEVLGVSSPGLHLRVIHQDNKFFYLAVFERHISIYDVSEGVLFEGRPKLDKIFRIPKAGLTVEGKKPE